MKTVARASRAWLERLEMTDVPGVLARDLYKGEHWHVVLSLRDAAAAAGIEVQTWIASAGYGLTSLDEEIKPYSATFAPSNPDSIARFSAPAKPGRLWWEHLRHRGRKVGRPTNLAELARHAPALPMLIAAGASYFDALSEDLLQAQAELHSPDLLQIVSAGTGQAPLFGRSFLPTDARLQAPLGGTRVSLNARILKAILQSAKRHDFEPRGVREVLGSLSLDACGGRPKRRRQRDEDIAAFIRAGFEENPGSPKSRLLRRLRDSGLACEQARFGEIYEAVTRAG